MHRVTERRGAFAAQSLEYEERSLREQAERDHELARSLHYESAGPHTQALRSPSPEDLPGLAAAHEKDAHSISHHPMEAEQWHRVDRRDHRAHAKTRNHNRSHCGHTPASSPSPPSAWAPQPFIAQSDRPTIILDSLNVGRSYNVGFRDLELNADMHTSGRPPVSALAITKAIDHFRNRGHKVVALLPEHFYHGGRDGLQYAHRHEILKPYIDDQVVCLMPARTDDDRFILAEAKKRESRKELVCILSNDNFDEYVANGTIQRDWRDRTILHFFWIGAELRVESKPGQHLDID